MSTARLLLRLLARPRRVRYGPHRDQHADLFRPRGGGRPPVVITVHGGSWEARFGAWVMRALVADLVGRGFAVWNVEYRRLGRGGGWPATFEDVAAAVDALAEVDAPLDLGRVTVLGHSAGGQLAVWAASRGALPAAAPGSLRGGAPAVAIARVVAQAGVIDLAGADRASPGGAVARLMGGGADEVPERYAVADPVALVPIPAPVLLVHGTDDRTVSVKRSRAYAAAARARDGDVTLVEIAGEAGLHRKHVDPRGDAWAAVVEWLGPARPSG